MASPAQTVHGGMMLSDTPEPIRRTIMGNALLLVETGPDLRDALLHLIDTARTSLKLCYYIFESDDSGRRVLARLIRARRRGVAVTLMVDAFGGGSTQPGFFDSLIRAGGHFGWFGARRSTRYLIRNHQKMAIADDARLLIGGFNVGDAYFGVSQSDGWPQSDSWPQNNCWADLGLLVDGPQVEAMVRWYSQLWRWTASRKQSFRQLRAMIRHWQPVRHPDLGDQFRWLIGGPTRRLSPWAQEVKRDLQKGRRIDMVAAYFSPGRGMLRRIGKLAKHGVARIVFPSRSDNGATIAAARLLYGPLLKHGARIWEYQPCKLHMKLIVIDDATYIGSANFDMRSLFLNLELMLRIDDAALADRMRGFITARIGESQEITPALHDARRGPVTFVTQWISYLLVGVIDYTVTRRLNFRLPDAD